MANYQPWKPTERIFARCQKARETATHKLSQKELAKVAGVSYVTYRKHLLVFQQYYRQCDNANKREPTGKPKGRRPGDTKIKVNSEVLQKVKWMVVARLPIGKIAAILGIDRTTFYNMMDKNKELKTTVDLARDEAITGVIKSLFERAIGYAHRDVHFASYMGNIYSRTYIKRYPPDVQAAMAILINYAGWKRDGGTEEDGSKGLILNTIGKMLGPDGINQPDGTDSGDVEQESPIAQP